MTPIELLQQELNTFKLALRGSEEALKGKKISKDLHEIHKENLKPKIQEYKNAIQTLIIFR